MVDVDSGGQRRYLLMQLKEGSEFLENQKEDLIQIWEGFKGKKVVSFYETMKTPSVRKVQMVQRFYAQMYLQFEYRIPVSKNHIDIVKFATRVDTTYLTVLNHIKECIARGSHGQCPVVSCNSSKIVIAQLIVFSVIVSADLSPPFTTEREAPPSSEYGVIQRISGPSNGANIEFVFNPNLQFVF
jgi:hypothetical protein